MRFTKVSAAFEGSAVTWTSAPGFGTLGLDVLGTFTGAFALLGSNNMSTWTPLAAREGVSAITIPGHYSYDVAGFSALRVVDAGAFSGEAILCGLLTPSSNLFALGQARQAHRTISQLVSPGPDGIIVSNTAATAALASRYNVEFVEGDSGVANFLRYLYVGTTGASSPPAAEYYVTYVSVGGSLKAIVYPTLEDARNETDAISSVTLDGDVINDKCAEVATDTAPWGWLYGTSANPAYTGKSIWRARSGGATYTLDLPADDSWIGRKYVLDLDLVVGNGTGGDQDITIDFAAGGTALGAAVAVTVPGGVEGHLCMRLALQFANVSLDGSQFRYAVTPETCTLDGEAVKPSSGTYYGVGTIADFHGQSLGATLEPAAYLGTLIIASRMTIEPEAA